MTTRDERIFFQFFKRLEKIRGSNKFQGVWKLCVKYEEY